MSNIERETWVDVCAYADLTPDTGICAMVDNDQVAIFLERLTEKLYAIANYDPIGKANVMSRGIMGSIGDETVVASPLYKQHFNLETGECLESPEHGIQTYAVRNNDGRVELQKVAAVMNDLENENAYVGFSDVMSSVVAS